MSRLSNAVFNTLSLLRHSSTFILNDPTTPDLSEIMESPSKGLLDFSVDGISESPSTSNEKRAANCHMVIGNCLNNMQQHCKTPIRKWASVPSIKVYPAAGRQLNAYYDRRSLKFFYYSHIGRNVYFSDSADIVTHELGHAFLDAMRPDFWSVQSLEIWSFHEAFSDIVAMFNLMCYEKAIKKALQETNGDLNRSNVISKLAEEVGIMVRSVTGDPSYLPEALRDPALEHFNYVDPARLSEEAPNNILAAESHSFGRVFSGAWYRIFVEFFKMHCESSDAVSAFRTARDSAFSILLHAIPLSPRTNKYYAAIARSMLAIGENRNKRYGKIISSVFSEWNIICPSEKVSAQSCGDLRASIISSLSKQDKVLKTDKTTAICLKNDRLIDLDRLPLASAMSLGGPVKVEIPYDSYYEFDGAGNLLYQDAPDEVSAARSAASCILKIADKIGEGMMWKVESGILKRQFIQ